MARGGITDINSCGGQRDMAKKAGTCIRQILPREVWVWLAKGVMVVGGDW